MRVKGNIVATLGATALALGLWAKDPIIMTVGGIDVPKSEFEYLYNKNSQQQLAQQQSIDEYVEMFKLYKMKVLAAKAAGIDTTAAFKAEMDKYRYDLASPYLTDSVYLNKLVKEAYGRMGEEVKAQHIMFFKTQNAKENIKNRNLLDSIKKAIQNGANFEELAVKYSQDRGSSANGGNMGYIMSLQYPYAFETAVYETPEGKVSELFETPMGYHIVKGNQHRNARGKVRASHILTLTRGKNESEQVRAKELIDSLYTVAVSNPEKFAELASTYSEDPGSARNGGDLSWFRSGDMVAEFDSVAFALNKGEISTPVKTSFGWHLIYKTDEAGIAPLSELKQTIIDRVMNPQDDRFVMIKENQNAMLAKLNKGKVNKKAFALLMKKSEQNGIDSVYYTSVSQPEIANAILFEIKGNKTRVADFIASLNGELCEDPVAAQKVIKRKFDSFYNNKLVEAEQSRLIATNKDYRNLMQEYHDGSLLYEISVKNIWDKASKDIEGQKKYFDAHRADFAWNKPKAKGYLVQATSDSIANLVKQASAAMGRDSLVNTIRKQFGSNVSIDNVLCEQGHNAMIDNLLFGGPEAKPTKSSYKVFFMIDPRVINAPEDYSDVRGAVASEYQNELQKIWEEELLKKYPVVINDKVKRSVKSSK